jgi:hypothetical protein
MNRVDAQAAITAYLMPLLAPAWGLTAEDAAAAIMRGPIDAMVADSPVYRELAAVRAATSREREGYEFEIATLRARLAAQETEVAV